MHHGIDSILGFVEGDAVNQCNLGTELQARLIKPFSVTGGKCTRVTKSQQITYSMHQGTRLTLLLTHPQYNCSFTNIRRQTSRWGTQFAPDGLDAIIQMPQANTFGATDRNQQSPTRIQKDFVKLLSEISIRGVCCRPAIQPYALLARKTPHRAKTALGVKY